MTTRRVFGKLGDGTEIEEVVIGAGVPGIGRRIGLAGVGIEREQRAPDEFAQDAQPAARGRRIHAAPAQQAGQRVRVVQRDRIRDAIAKFFARSGAARAGWRDRGACGFPRRTVDRLAGRARHAREHDLAMSAHATMDRLAAQVRLRHCRLHDRQPHQQPVPGHRAHLHGCEASIPMRAVPRAIQAAAMREQTASVARARLSV